MIHNEKIFRDQFIFRFNVYLDHHIAIVSVKSKLQHAPPGQPPGHLTFLKIIVQKPPYLGQNAVQMPHTKVHSGD